MKVSKISIVIPCLNESKYLESTIRSILLNINKNTLEYEILLMDNGSNDGSPEIARKMGLRVIIRPGISIAELRNEGVAYSSGDIIAFLDGDVEITSNWFDSLINFSEKVKGNPFVISGVTVLRPPGSSLLERARFNGRNFSSNYINSGNLITTRELFQRIGGFNSNLTTGEDWDFCSRARKEGTIVEINPGFRAFHHGFPKNLTTFFRRELWHGQGDYFNFSTFIRSKPALLAVINVFFFIIWLCCVFLINSYVMLYAYPLMLFFICLTIALKRSEAVWQIPGNFILGFFYIFARSGSFVISLIRRLKLI